MSIFSKYKSSDVATILIRGSICIAIILAVAATIIVYFFLLPKQKYTDAVALMEKEYFSEARNKFTELGSFMDSVQKANECTALYYSQVYDAGVEAFEEQDYIKALLSFGDVINEYKEAPGYIEQCVSRIQDSYSPKYVWDFSESLSERNGLECTSHGNVELSNDSEDYYQDYFWNFAYFTGDDDSEDYIECGRDLNMPENASYCFAFRCDDVSKNYGALFAKYETNGEGPYAFSIHNKHFNIWITDPEGDYIEFDSKTELENAQDYYVSVVKMGNQIKLYINGVLDTERTINGVAQNDDLATIGRQALMFEPYNELKYSGCIYRIAIYDYALEEEQVKILSASGSSPTYSIMLENLRTVIKT